MKLKSCILYVMIIVGLISCNSKSTAASADSEQMVLIKTEFGDMKVKLYNETPIHRDNFIKLVKEGYYDDLLFHRVISGFMIQGGDPDSKNASLNKRLGNGGPHYRLSSEINEGIYHKKGALAAARQADAQNPERKSSGSQFYIVQGKVWNNEKLDQLEEKATFQAVRNEGMKLFKVRQKEIVKLQKEGLIDSLNAIRIEIQEEAAHKVDSSIFVINKERREIYSTIGGTPHLDGAYTVFGEVVEGLNVIDSIAKVKTGAGDRPIENIKMTMELIK